MPNRSYHYDGNETQCKKTENNEAIIYVGKYYEINLTSGEVTIHYYLGECLVAFKKGANVRWRHQDHLGDSIGYRCQRQLRTLHKLPVLLLHQVRASPGGPQVHKATDG